LVGINSDSDLLSPSRKLEDELDDLVRRMSAVAYERREDIHKAGRRLRRAFLGPISDDEQTKRAQEGRRARLDDDDMTIMEIVLDLAAQEAKIDEAGRLVGGLRRRGLAGKIHDVLEERWLKANKTGQPPWLVKSIREKLKRLKKKFPPTIIDADDPK
jgi:hypothetical protein